MYLAEKLLIAKLPSTTTDSFADLSSKLFENQVGGACDVCTLSLAGRHVAGGNAQGAGECSGSNPGS